MKHCPNEIETNIAESVFNVAFPILYCQKHRILLTNNLLLNKYM